MNKMLKDLDDRGAHEHGDGSDYQEPPESKRIRYMIFFIAFIGVSAAGYFSYRAMGPEYFVDLYTQTMQFISGEEPKQQQSKKVSVNSALDQMMPTRGGVPVIDEPVKPPQVTNMQNEQELLAKSQPSESAVQATTATASADDEQNRQTAGDAEDDFAEADFAATQSADSQPQAKEAGSQNTAEPVVTVGQTLVPVAPGRGSFVQVSGVEGATAQITELSSLASQAVAENNVERAITLYRQILNVDFKQHDIRKKLAVLLYSNGNNGAASVVLSDGIDIAPQRVDFRLMLARLFYREKKLRAAYTVLEGVDPDVQRNIDFYGLKATVAQELELNAESSHLYGRLVIFEPNRAQWWLGLAVSLDRMSQRDGALKAYENAADLRQLSASANDFIKQRILELGG
ncbi:tetratricopeptide repeat protein [Planctobacterium marinum]|uniref:tetratricopeptide repeat protein n=1 Tax=Planctobacterium marinum TaxID=1631968 RepID=UPI001E3668EE|nr:tetratricopeptide repeat protein [Planctobacterium marinum]MCC2608022.1 tetratricopeptide repeat protein [Planctobacterium marinum]